MHKVIQIHPARVSPAGRQRPPVYLREFVYPPLLSGRKVEVGITEDPAQAKHYGGVSTEGAVALLLSLGYEDVLEVDVED